MKRLIIGTAVILSGCVVEPAPMYSTPQYQNYQPTPYPQQYQQQYQQPATMYEQPAPQPVVSVYVEPPLVQPAPVMVGWAPPPMLVEAPPPMPFEGAIWTGGYWVWEGDWVWAHGRWAGPPHPGYAWVNPYYENRGGGVVFVNGFWAAPNVVFVPPPMGISIAVGVVAAGVVAGPRCSGPEGVFVPAPPGSHRGLIVPAPIGTSPAVVTSAPPIINQGMHITAINNVHNITNVTNVANVTIVAPPGSTANGQAFNNSVPVQPHLAAAMTPVVQAPAPQPASTKAIPAYVAGHQPAILPPAQVVHTVVPAALSQPHQTLLPQRPPQQSLQQPGYAQPPQQTPQTWQATPHPAPAAVAPDYRYQTNVPRPQPQPQTQAQPTPRPVENGKQVEPARPPVVVPRPAGQPQGKPPTENKEKKPEEERHEH